MKLYFIGIGNKLFSTTLEPNSYRSESKTCLIGLTNYNKACSLRSHIVESQKPVDNIDYYDFVEIKKIDYNSRDFQKILKVNNFALMLAHDYFVDPLTNEYEFKGSTLIPDFGIDFYTRQHLDRLLDDNSLNEV